MADLHIPDEAIRVGSELMFDDYESDEAIAADVREIAAPVVAAELERLAAELDAKFQPVRIGRAVESSSGYRREGVEIALRVLRARAAELDGDARG